MDNANIRSITAWAGIAAGITVFATIPLYFVYDGPPPANNVFTRCLIGLFMAVFMLVFFSGFTQLIRKEGAERSLPAPSSPEASSCHPFATSSSSDRVLPV